MIVVLYLHGMFKTTRIASLYIWALVFLGPILFAQNDVFYPEPGEGFTFNSSALVLMGAPSSYASGLKANSQEIQLLRENHIGLSHFAVAYGLGYSGHYYHGNLHVHIDPDGTQTIEDLTGVSYESNRFVLEFTDAVFELRYRSKSNKKGRYTRFYVGALAGYRTDAYSYFKSPDYRVKFYNIDGFNRYRYGAYVKAGRGPLNLYGYYGMNPLVVSGPMLSEWSTTTSANVGLSLTL